MMRWQTPKGTIELAPLNVNDKHTIPVSELYKDAMAHFNGGRLVEAGALCQCILRLLPEHADTLHLLGLIYHQSGQHLRAIDLLSNAIRLNPQNAQFFNNYGEIHRALGHVNEAKIQYEKALALEPDFGIAHNNLANVLSATANYDEAVVHYKRAIALIPAYAEAYRNLTLITAPAPEDNKTKAMQNLLGNPAVSDSDAMHLHFALGRIYENAKAYDTAFEHYHKGNQLKRKSFNFDVSTRTTYIDSLINTYTPDYFQRVAGYGNNSERPVFIVGMPRSGTTLVEQIISSHPQIFGAGELIYLQNIEQTMTQQLGTSEPYPVCMQAFTPDLAQQLAGQYLEHLQAYSTTARHVTDKMPGNYQRIGLIKTLFPNARIIHCRRNPMDTCVSIYCNYFRGTHNYAYDLRELGLFYREYERLMTHWRNLFGEDIHEIQYEELTRQQEKLSRGLIAYLGLDWDDRCLEFYNNKRPVQTASNLQVTQPMYTTSIDKWKRYEKHLGPLQDALTQHIRQD
jgi:tetratricopeptide (TPR) repeat protein